MKAIVLHEPGPPEHLIFEDLPVPELSSGCVLVRVRAAGVCYRDVIDRRGGFPFMKRPVVPGHEFAGVVEAAAPDVEDLRVGDRVVNLHRAPCGECEYCLAGHEPRCARSFMMFGLTLDGGYAEQVLAPAKSLVRLPDDVPFETGCFLACTAGVALRGLVTRGGLRAGETALITGASGGVGLHAIQVAKLLGARVVAITSSPSKEAALREAGADEVVVSTDLRFHKEVKRRTDGVHVVLECVGAPTLDSSIRSVRPMGRVVVVGNVTVEREPVNPGYLILQEVSISGSSSCTRADLARVLAWVSEGKLEPSLAEVLPLKDAAKAHRRLEDKGVVGRLVLLPHGAR
jgi:D-arabinose 1-dehydrogenase-like Zn-dependent alcohol dehydrogenase